MINIKEVKYDNETIFRVEVKEDNKSLVISDIKYRAVVKDIDKKPYLLLYDSSNVPVSQAFRYLNHGLSGKTLNTRIKSLYALKLLYSFQAIISSSIEDFTVSDVTNLKHFLKGLSPKGNSISFDISSSRSNATINGYLSIYRQYLEYLGVENKAFTQKFSAKVNSLIPNTDRNISTERYKSSERTPKKPIEVPMYISVDEFFQILEEVRRNHSMRDEIIIRLMFECGLRIGEVLGLTSDDLVVEKVGEAYITVAYIRNRISNKRDQNAKTCMKVMDAKQYNSKEYKTEGYGYHKIIIPEDLFTHINEYIESAHILAREKHTDNYYKNTIADRVSKVENADDVNYYVFINSIGNVLLSHLWNTKLRTIFRAVGIVVDSVTREHNLNHRFRHGFAMFNVQYLHLNEVELMERMRHSSIESVAYYYNPTLKDTIKIKTDFSNTLYNLIPSLKNTGGDPCQSERLPNL